MYKFCQDELIAHICFIQAAKSSIPTRLALINRITSSLSQAFCFISLYKGCQGPSVASSTIQQCHSTFFQTLESFICIWPASFSEAHSNENIFSGRMNPRACSSPSALFNHTSLHFDSIPVDMYVRMCPETVCSASMCAVQV